LTESLYHLPTEAAVSNSHCVEAPSSTIAVASFNCGNLHIHAAVVRRNATTVNSETRRSSIAMLTVNETCTPVSIALRLPEWQQHAGELVLSAAHLDLLQPRVQRLFGTDAIVCPEHKLVYIDNVKAGSTTIRTTRSLIGCSWTSYTDWLEQHTIDTHCAGLQVFNTMVRGGSEIKLYIFFNCT
jgi:hypothetical protein